MKKTCENRHWFDEKAEYLNWHSMAEVLHKKKHKQFRCDKCGLWHWPKASVDSYLRGDYAAKKRGRRDAKEKVT